MAVQYDGTKEKHYVNGLLADSDTCKGEPHQSAALVRQIGHFKPCMTDIYLHIDARMADYMATHPYV